MPKRTDIHSILLIGSGPILIGQACEFDYSGTQAVKALKEEGYRVILINSNPATIMTDPGLADRTYVEPITPEVVTQIIEQERPDALLPTMGAQTALNTAIHLHEMGVLDRFGVKLIGASIEAIRKAENRELFRQAIGRIGLKLAESGTAHDLREALDIVGRTGFPAIIRPSFTLGGMGGSVVQGPEQFEAAVAWGLDCSPTREILIEASLLGWKEFELEVMRDRADNVVIVCSIENLDPMGIHTGDSITVAPVQTLTDREYQRMRDAAMAIIREIGVETGGSNIQFAVNPENGDLVVIEMNPRVSRSSALASKATGFPIAKIAAKLAVGYTLDEIPNDITRQTPACFEPTVDYVVTKVPRFTFEKFPEASKLLSTQMKSVGEVMAIGRTFKESLQKALRSLEIDRTGFDEKDEPEATDALVRQRIGEPYANRIWYVAEGFRRGMALEEIHRLSRIDPWFLTSIRQIVEEEREIRQIGSSLLDDPDRLRRAKRMGFSDRRLGRLVRSDEETVRARRHAMGIRPVFKRVDTCAAEFIAHTPYLYSTYEETCEAQPTDNPRKVVILGGGPNRIGQGIEFDYCCVHAAYALREAGWEVLMVNCNPETVSTDYDTSDRLYFEPITLEDVLEILHVEKPAGVILQFGGQTPLKLAVALERRGIRILGTSSEAIDRAEDRQRFNAMMEKLGLRQPVSGTARTIEAARRVAERIGYPVMVRPSYVLGGRAMEIVHDQPVLDRYMAQAIRFSPDHPVLIDQYLIDAVELDVDAVGDGERIVIGGLMEHIEEAGIHSGDSACCLPPHTVSEAHQAEIRRQTEALGMELGILGLMNVQFAIAGGNIYVLEVNPRASRTAPFVSKAIGRPLAKIAARTLIGQSLVQQDFTEYARPSYRSVKESVFPFLKFAGVDPLLGPEMKSTGEVMGLADDFPEAFWKSQLGAGQRLPDGGTVFISVKDSDKPRVVAAARRLAALGFSLIATKGTARGLAQQGLAVRSINKVREGPPHIVDRIQSRDIHLVINTTEGAEAIADSASIRRSALIAGLPYTTTVAGAEAISLAIASIRRRRPRVKPLQDYHRPA